MFAGDSSRVVQGWTDFGARLD